MKIESRRRVSAKLARPRRTRRRLLWQLAPWLLAGLAMLWGAFVGGLLPRPDTALYGWALERGHQAYGQKSLRELLPKIPGRLSGAGEMPRLVIDIGFEEMQFLYARRAEALAQRTLVQREDDFVDASIRHGRETTPVKLRLKGDFTDHLETDKWSFRIHVRDGEHIFGMRRFSLQHPRVRFYQGEALFLEYLRQIGVLAPRYFFVAVTVNGNDVGIMALEEHFSKELLESQGRREGVILKFDESQYWQERLTRGFDTWRQRRNTTYANSPVDVFRRSTLLRSPALAKDLQTGVGLLRGFVAGDLPASEVFDPETTARFLAATELWSARHGIFWNNLRFYLDPLTLRLEPIGFDGGVANHPDHDEIYGHDEPFTTRLLDDPVIEAAYVRNLRQLAIEWLEGEVPAQLQAEEQRHLAILRSDFTLLEGFPFDEMDRRARFLAQIDEQLLLRHRASRDVYPALAQALLIPASGDTLLQLSSVVPHPVEILSARWLDANGSPVEDLLLLGNATLPLILEPTPSGDAPQMRSFRFVRPSSPDLELELLTSIVGQDSAQPLRARETIAALSAHPLAALERANPLESHSFLRIDHAARTVHVIPGSWTLAGDLLIPRGYSLKVEAGTTLRFAPGACLVAQGATRLEGSANAPIVLESLDADSTWGGVVVLHGDARSSWSHVEVRRTAGIDRAWWTPTGGVTFRGGEVELHDCRFLGHRGEDALNIVGAQLLLEELTIAETMSDGLDVDFGWGEIRGIRFHDIGAVSGGDALDLSGARIVLERGEFLRVQDKALSVGEGSQLRASGLEIREVMVGVASKDGSALELSDARFESVQLAALMAYVKKPVYGSSRIQARDLDFTLLAEDARARVQTGCSIELDGAVIESEALDVDELYETVMRPGLRR